MQGRKNAVVKGGVRGDTRRQSNPGGKYIDEVKESQGAT